MPRMTALKQRVAAEVDQHRADLWSLARRIHRRPELGYREMRAAAWLTGFLEALGFRVERGLCDLPTAFRATYGSGGPAIAILAEYDALPKLGHACGHNIIAAAAVGAGLGARVAAQRTGGTVMVIGTPAEESEGGKAVLAERGAFRDLDAALIVHPANENRASIAALACISLEVEFYGRAAHAAGSPHQGTNALDALVLAWNALNALRQHLRDGSRIHGVITDGGEAANIIPAHSAASLMVRTRDDAHLDELMSRVLSCFRGAAESTGARLEYRWSPVRLASMRTNRALADLFARNMALLGRRALPLDPARIYGSTDMGNVSALVPAIHPLVAIAPPDVPVHSPEFVQAAVSSEARKGMLDGAKAMALTVADLLARPEALRRVRDEFFASE